MLPKHRQLPNNAVVSSPHHCEMLSALSIITHPWSYYRYSVGKRGQVTTGTDNAISQDIVNHTNQ